MWPKILLELLPHLTRLAPVADKYFASHGARDEAQEAALVALGDEVRLGLKRTAESQAGVQQALKSQAEQVTAVAVEVTRVRMGLDGLEERVVRMEKSNAAMVRLLMTSTALLVFCMVLLVVVLLRLKG